MSNVSSEIDDSLSSPSSVIGQTKMDGSLNRQSNDEFNSQQGKRKFSLSQYKEHKRLKSNELSQNSLTDTDMRINHQVRIRSYPCNDMRKSIVEKQIRSL